MIFQFNKEQINAKFFKSEAQEWLASQQNAGSSDDIVMMSPSQMIDVFMTPQSEDELSEGSPSPP